MGQNLVYWLTKKSAEPLGSLGDQVNTHDQYPVFGTGSNFIQIGKLWEPSPLRSRQSKNKNKGSNQPPNNSLFYMCTLLRAEQQKCFNILCKKDPKLLKQDLKVFFLYIAAEV